MSGNFFLYDVNFFRGLRNVLRDMIRLLHDDEVYLNVYTRAIKLYTNPALIELLRMYTNIHELLLYDCDFYVETYFIRMSELKNIPDLFGDVFNDVNKLFESIRDLYICNDINICDGSRYVNAINSIAFPCAPCVPKVGPVCIETHVYPLAFVVWLITTLGKLLSGCADVDLSVTEGLIFMMQIITLTKSYDNFIKVGTSLQHVPRYVEHKFWNKKIIN